MADIRQSRQMAAKATLDSAILVVEESTAATTFYDRSRHLSKLRWAIQEATAHDVIVPPRADSLYRQHALRLQTEAAPDAERILRQVPGLVHFTKQFGDSVEPTTRTFTSARLTHSSKLLLDSLSQLTAGADLWPDSALSARFTVASKAAYRFEMAQRRFGLMSASFADAWIASIQADIDSLSARCARAPLDSHGHRDHYGNCARSVSRRQAELSRFRHRIGRPAPPA